MYSTPAIPEKTKDPAPHLLSLPNEVLLLVADHFDCSRDLYPLFLTNRHLFVLLTPRLHKFALQDRGSLSALQWATYKGYIGLAKLLLNKGVDVNYTTLGGWRSEWPPIFYAIRSCKLAMVELLLDSGADVNTRGTTNDTPLHVAVYSMTNAMELNMDTTETHAKRDFREKAAEMPAVMRMLLERHAEVQTINHYSFSPFQEASRRCTETTMQPLQMLFDHGADINYLAVGGMTPLHTAALRGGEAAARFLVQHGASPMAKNKDGFTPFQLAMHRGHRPIVNYLSQFEPPDDESKQ